MNWQKIEFQSFLLNEVDLDKEIDYVYNRNGTDEYTGRGWQRRSAFFDFHITYYNKSGKYLMKNLEYARITSKMHDQRQAELERKYNFWIKQFKRKLISDEKQKNSSQKKVKK